MAWANGFLQCTFSFLFLCECSPAFCSANVHWFCYWVWDGKGCLGVSQDTPSVWGRRICQPDYPLPASLRSLWLRFKQNTELKQKEREGASTQKKVPVPNCIAEHSTQEKPSCRKVRWLCVHSLLWIHTHTRSHKLPPLSLSQTHFSLIRNSEAIVPSCKKEKKKKSYFRKLGLFLSISQVSW